MWLRSRSETWSTILCHTVAAKAFGLHQPLFLAAFMDGCHCALTNLRLDLTILWQSRARSQAMRDAAALRACLDQPCHVGNAAAV